MLGGLGLLLAHHADDRHQRDVDVEHVVAPYVFAELADGLQERQALYVADGAAHLGDEHVYPQLLRQTVHAALDLVGDVRNDLDGATQIVAAPLLGDDRAVDAARGHVAFPLHEFVDETLVVAQVQVRLGAVLGDVHLSVLERTHGARIYVDVGIELLVGDLQAALLEQTP